MSYFDPTTFFSDPMGTALSSYINILGTWIYAILIGTMGGYVLIKTESWAPASGILLLGAIVFSAILPPLVFIIFAIAAGLTFTFILVDIFLLK